MTTKTKPNRFRFTPTRLEDLPRQPGVWHDIDQIGLTVRRQSVDGELVLYARYRTPGASGSGRLRLGRTNELPLAKARRMALDAVVEAKRGNDPSKARKAAQKAAETEKAKAVALDAFLDEYLEVQKDVRSAPERVKAVRQHLKTFLGRPLQDVTRRELAMALDGVRKDYPAAATKLQASVHHVFEIAFDRGIVDANPLAGRGKRRGSNKARNVAKAEQENGAQSLDALARMWIAADDPRVNSNFAAYVRTMIATGARRAELAAAEIDHLAPSSRRLPRPPDALQPGTTKNGKAHTLFLPPLVMRAIDRVRRYPGEALLFPGRRRGGESAMMTGWSKSLPPLVEAARKLGVQDHIHLHGFRRSFRTGLSRLGVSHAVAELMLNHAQDKLTAAYDKHDFAAERAEAAERWCEALKPPSPPVDAELSPTQATANDEYHERALSRLAAASAQGHSRSAKPTGRRSVDDPAAPCARRQASSRVRREASPETHMSNLGPKAPGELNANWTPP